MDSSTSVPVILPSAIVCDIFRKRNSPIELHEILLLPRLGRLGRHPSKLRRSLVVVWREFLPTKATAVIFVLLATLILLYRQFQR